MFHMTAAPKTDELTVQQLREDGFVDDLAGRCNTREKAHDLLRRVGVEPSRLPAFETGADPTVWWSGAVEKLADGLVVDGLQKIVQQAEAMGITRQVEYIFGEPVKARSRI